MEEISEEFKKEIEAYQKEREEEIQKRIEKEKEIKEKFPIGEEVPVKRSSGAFELEGWKVKGFEKEKIIVEKKEKDKLLRKIVSPELLSSWKEEAEIIHAKEKIKELKNQRDQILAWGETTIEDRRLINNIEKEIKYWENKIKELEEKRKAA